MALEPENKKNTRKTELHEPVPRQFAISTAGEVVAFSLAIGAVYVSEKFFPKQTNAFIAHLAENLGKWRGVTPETQAGLAKKIFDVGIMNMAGATGMAVQFGIRRSNQSEKEKTPLWYEAGRLAAGRIIGTITAISALALVGTRSPEFMKKMETGVSRKLGATAQSDRFAELLISNSVQSVGAILGNAPAQLLYDHLVTPPEKSVSK